MGSPPHDHTAAEAASNPRTVSRGFHAHSLVNLSFDSLYLSVEYPHADVFHRWALGVSDLHDPKLYNGIPYEGFVLKHGAHGYKLSVWWGDARIYITDRVNDTLEGGEHEGQGMGILMQLGPKWLQQYGEPFADNTLRTHVEGMLMLFGLKKPINYPIRINRMDVALDLKGLDINSFSLDEWQDGWVGFANVADFHNDRRTGKLSGIIVGSRSSNVSLVVYDKVLEATRRGTLGFWRSVWKVTDEEAGNLAVTRFEWSFRCYQAKFTRLRYLEDYTFEGFMALLNYATLIWGELRIPGTSQRNKQRWDLHPLWKAIVAHIAAWTYDYEDIVRPQYDLKPDIKDSYLRSLAGWLAGLQARLGVEKSKDEAASLAQALSFLTERGHSIQDIADRANAKFKVFSVLAEGGLPDDDAE